MKQSVIILSFILRKINIIYLVIYTLFDTICLAPFISTWIIMKINGFENYSGIKPLFYRSDIHYALNPCG